VLAGRLERLGGAAGGPDRDVTKRWFFQAMAGTDRYPNDPVARHIERSLDISEQVVVDTPAALAVSFDFGKFIEPIAQG
jgi:hypothetical protein